MGEKKFSLTDFKKNVVHKPYLFGGRDSLDVSKVQMSRWFQAKDLSGNET